MEMSRRLQFAIVGLATIGLIGSAEAGAAELRTTAAINLRAGPGTTFARLAKLPQGTAVEVQARQGDWAKVGYGGTAGWVLATYLSTPNLRPQLSPASSFAAPQRPSLPPPGWQAPASATAPPRPLYDATPRFDRPPPAFGVQSHDTQRTYQTEGYRSPHPGVGEQYWPGEWNRQR
jgi:Bacterial SH3 domain